MDYRYYGKIEEYFRKHPGYVKPFRRANSLLTLAGFIMYPLLLFVMALRAYDWKLIGIYVLIPGLSFLLLSLYRKHRNAPRPYERYDIDPVIKKDSTGNSFPSRHVFSSFLIAVLWMKIFLPAGIILFLLSCLLGLVRVAGGVHFIIDVCAGALVGILAGIFTILAAGCLPV